MSSSEPVVSADASAAAAVAAKLDAAPTVVPVLITVDPQEYTHRHYEAVLRIHLTALSERLRRQHNVELALVDARSYFDPLCMNDSPMTSAATWAMIV